MTSEEYDVQKEKIDEAADKLEKCIVAPGESESLRFEFQLMRTRIQRTKTISEGDIEAVLAHVQSAWKLITENRLNWIEGDDELK